MATTARSFISKPSNHANLRARLAEARIHTDLLFTMIRSEALTDRPIPERHRLIFYLGHLEAFDWNLLGRGAARLPSFHARFDQLFAFGIDPVGGGLPNDVPSDWPSETEIRNYNLRIRGTIDRLVAQPGKLPAVGVDGSPEVLVQTAIEHRLMHAETLAYLLHQLPLKKKIALRAPENTDAAEPAYSEIEIPAGCAMLGQKRGASFGWDNEFEETSVEVAAFRTGKYPVTNGQFLEFVRAGGYRERTLWSEADWNWIESSGIEHPLFWIRERDGWNWRAMFAEIPLPLAWPVYVSHAEASAFARWRERRLPTEAEWQRMAYSIPTGEERSYPWGAASPSAEFGNFDFERWDPSPVQAHPAGDSGFGVSDLIGNGWEWTSSRFEPLPGFRPFPFYPGYSANFFDGSHFVMKGGSPRTAACMLRKSFRNWFQPHYPYVYAKFRCVEG